MASPEKVFKKAARTEKASEELSSIPEKFPPFEYQMEVADKAVAALEKDGKALIDMATGLGKTRVAIEITERLGPKRILVLADTRKLLEDHQRTLTRYLGDRYTIGMFNGGTKDSDVDILLATRQSMRNHKERFDPEEFEQLIDDESHHAMATTYEPTLHYFKPKYLIGMTATPDRIDWKDIREIFGPPVVSITLEEGMRNGWLTPVDYRLVMDDVDEAALKRVIQAEAGTTSLKEINREIFRQKSLEERLEHLVNNVGSRQTAVMCSSIEEAERAAYILREMGCLAEGFHTKSDDDESLKRFRDGSTQFITAVDLLNEGIDVPELGAVAFMRPTDSKRIFLQQLGRVLRKYPGKDTALVLDYVGSVERLAQINEIMREIKSGPHPDNDNEAFFDTHLIGGDNVFTFDQEVVEKIGEILKANERRYGSYKEAKEKVHDLKLRNRGEYFALKPKPLGLPNNPEKAFKRDWEGWKPFLGMERLEDGVEQLTLDEVKARIKKFNILTLNQYELYSVMVDSKEQKRFPSLKELEAQGIAPETLGLKPWQDMDEEERGSYIGDAVMFHWGGDYIKYYRPKEKIEVYGLSEYRVPAKVRQQAREKIIQYSKDMPGREQDVRFKSQYSLEIPEAEYDAKRRLDKFIDKLQDRGLLIPEFFEEDIFEDVCRTILYDVHCDFLGSYENEDPKYGGPLRPIMGPRKGLPLPPE